MKEINFLKMNKNRFFGLLGVILVIVIFGFAYPGVYKRINIPLFYGGDAIFAGEGIKNILETGWNIFNPNVGAPFGQSMLAYPNSDGFSLIIIKLIGFFTNDWGITINIFYLLTYILVTLSGFLVMVKLGTRTGPALVFSILYAFLPYHLMRGEGHLYLSMYFVVPLVIYVTYDILTFKDLNEIDPKTHRLVPLILLGLVTSSTGVYYAFFSLIIIVFAIVSRIAMVRNIKSIKPYLVLVFVLIIGVIINVLPSLFYLMTKAQNNFTWRSPSESEIYGLKIVQLFLPRAGGSFNFWRGIADKYNQLMPLVNENQMASLGFLGSLGLLFGLAAMVLWPNKLTFDAIIKLARINIVMILLATIGGFGSLLAIFGFTEIRAYNRISVFIAFISLFTSAKILSQLLDKLKSDWKSKIIISIGLIFILGFGLKDQVNFPETDSSSIVKAFTADRTYFSKLQKLIPKNAMVLQLPYVPFPENPPVYGMGDYDQFRAYLHTKYIRWSYGVMKGSKGDELLKTLSSLTARNIIDYSRHIGYSGILINLHGYQDSGTSITRDFETVLGNQGFEGDGFVYFSIIQNANIVNITEKELEKRIFEFWGKIRGIDLDIPVLFPSPIFAEGWWPNESNGRWSNQDAHILCTVNGYKAMGGSIVFDLQYINTIGQQDVNVVINKKSIGIYKCEGKGVLRVDFPSSLIGSDNSLDIELKIPNARTPGGGDKRTLGIFVTSFVLSDGKNISVYNSYSDPYIFINGFSSPQLWGIWSNGPKSEISIKVKSDLNVLLNFLVLPYLPKPNMSLVVTVSVNGRKITDWMFKSGEIFPVDKTIEIPKNMIRPDGKLNLIFSYSETNSPSSLDQGTDMQQLALGFISLSVKQ